MKAIVAIFAVLLLSACSSVTTQPRTIKVSMVGWVKNPGDYVLPQGATIVAALDAAGGFRDSSYSNILRILRKAGGQERWIHVRLHYESGRPKAEFQLINGDEIYARDRLW